MAINQQYIGYDNLVTISNVTADSEAAGYPITNLANPATNLKWKSDSTEEQYITVSIGGGTPVNYIGIAAHNLGTTRCAIDIEAQESGSSDWYSILNFPYYPEDDKPILRIAPGAASYGCSWNQGGSYYGCAWDQDGSYTYATWDQSGDSYTGGHFDDPTADSYDTFTYDDADADTYATYGSYTAIRIKLDPAAVLVKPQIGVLYVGNILQLERGIYVGHTPITLGREVTAVNGMAESGDFLGRIIRQTTFKSSIRMRHLTPVWYRNEFDPFVQACKTKPFFYAWRLNSYADEIGYCWFSGGVPVPENTGPRGMMSVSFNIGGQA